MESAKKVTAKPKPKRRSKRTTYASISQRNLNVRELVPIVKIAEQITLWCQDLWQNNFHRNVFNFHFVQACGARVKFPCRMDMNHSAIHPIIFESLKKSGLEPQMVIDQPNFVPGYFTLTSAIDATWTVSLFDYEVKGSTVQYKRLNVPRV